MLLRVDIAGREPLVRRALFLENGHAQSGYFLVERVLVR